MKVMESPAGKTELGKKPPVNNNVLNKKSPAHQLCRHVRRAAVAGALSLIAAVSTAHGALQFSDSFNYTPGALAGLGPPPGSPPGQTGWTNLRGNAQVTAPGLGFTGDFSIGNKATTAGLANADADLVSVNVPQIVGGTEWVAFLINQASGPAAPGGYAVVGLGMENGIGMLFNENIYGIDTTPLGGLIVMRARTSTAPSASTVLLVTKLDFTAGMEYIFVNPVGGSTPSNAQADGSIPMGANFKANGFSEINLAEGFNAATFNFDELRIATNFAEAVPEPSPATLGNISTRLNVQTSGNVGIGGFIITGTDPKLVVIRGIGPSLANFGVTGALADPELELHDSTGAIIATNDNWMDNTPADQATLTSHMLAPTNAAEAAIVKTLPPGSYTAILEGTNGSTGVGLVEAYDLDPAAASQLANISTRGLVETNANVMIGGFIIVGGAGAKPRTIVARGIGPSLTAFGVMGALQDPTLELHDSQGVTLASNDNWMDSPDMQTIIDDGLAPKASKESALVAILPPGRYTAILSGVNNTTGVGLVEAYDIP